MAIALPLIALCLGLIYGLLLIRNRLALVFWLSMLAYLVAFGWAILEGRQQSGFDGIGYGIFAVLMVAPLAAGTLIGAGISLVRRGNSGEEAGDDGDAADPRDPDP